MRYRIIDTHRNLSTKTKLAMAKFFEEAKSLNDKEAFEQVDFVDWFEHEFAVKWFEIVVFDSDKVVGFLRCLRYPDRPEQWYIGDVNVLRAYRGQNIATKMYEKTINEVEKYEAAEGIVTSVHKENTISIGLHSKLGFIDTNIACDFPDFYFDEDETAYLKKIFRFYSVSNNDLTVRSLVDIWQEYKKNIFNIEMATPDIYEEISSLVKEHNNNQFETIWCGNKLVGFSYMDEGEEIYYNNMELC